MHSIFRTRAFVAVLAIAAMLAVAVGASAARTKATGGTATLSLSGPAAAALKANNFKLAPIAPATAVGGSLVLPINRGSFNAKNLTGRLFLGGGLKISHGKRSVPVRHLVINSTRKGGYLVAILRVPKKIAKKIHRAVRKHHAHGVLVHKRIVALRIGKLVNPVKSSDGKSVKVTVQATSVLALVFNRVAGKHIVSAGNVIGSAVVAPTTGP
jgi:hypothetical protein